MTRLDRGVARRLGRAAAILAGAAVAAGVVAGVVLSDTNASVDPAAPDPEHAADEDAAGGSATPTPKTTPPTLDASSRATTVDYNCGGPGRGSPWLEHQPGPEAGPYFAGFFWATQWSYQFFLPVPTVDGLPVSVDDAYRLLCRHHPQLGGDGLRLLTDAELHAAQYDWEYADEYTVFPPEYYTDDQPLGAGEAYSAHGQDIRIYWLPPMPESLVQALRGTAPMPAPTPEPRDTTQRWRVTVGGHELDEMDPYWRVTTGVRGAVQFDYVLEAEFTTQRESGTWVYDEGVITAMTVDISTEYEPDGTWALRPPTCTNCGGLRAGLPLRGEVHPNGDLVLTWGSFRPTVQMEAQIIASCTPMPSCADWGVRRFVSQSFFEVVNAQPLTLTDGFSDVFSTGASGASGDRVVASFTLRQLPPG